jgi:predicted flavoprotein YhiN
MKTVAIIGGGASGMAAAVTASRDPENRIILFERQQRVGRKLLSTGNGRCNLTNTGAAPGNYHGAHPDFAVPALKKYAACRGAGILRRALGLVTREEYGGRVYPLSNSANSAADVLRFALEKPNIAEVRTDCPVRGAAQPRRL